jgi:signal transduction histidine kinase
MRHLALASVNPAPSAQWAHDIRNALATVGLHLETLERLSGSGGREIALAAQTLMSRAAAMCNDAMAQNSQIASSRRRGFDIIKTIVQIANLLRATAPEGFEIRVAASGAFIVLADPQEVFRILFNLVHNAITIARQGKQMTHVTLLVERVGATVTVRIADDGPGLPKAVRAKLFRPQRSATGGNGLGRSSGLGLGSGLGLSIARELAERNGGVLQLVETARGATFMLELTGLAAMPSEESGALRSLGKRVVQH